MLWVDSFHPFSPSPLHPFSSGPPSDLVEVQLCPRPVRRACPPSVGARHRFPPVHSPSRAASQRAAWPRTSSGRTASSTPRRASAPPPCDQQRTESAARLVPRVCSPAPLRSRLVVALEVALN